MGFGVLGFALLMVGAPVVGTVADLSDAKWICHPIDGTARVLKSPNPNDLHEDWKGESRFGTGMGFIPQGAEKDVYDLQYFSGFVLSGRGSVLTERAFILSKEWNCERLEQK